MRRCPGRVAVALLALGASRPADGQQKLPPIRPLASAERVSTDLLGSVSATRALPGGRVLVNDISGRKVVLFDSTLKSFTIVADTTSATANAYSSRAAGLIAYRGDSTLIVDPTSLSMLVIDGAGKIGRVMSIPRPNDAGSLIGGPNGTPAFDAKGRMVYRQFPQFRFGQGGRQRAGTGPAGGAARPSDAPGANGGVPAPPEFPDSLAIVRIDLTTRQLDTVSFVKIPKNRVSMAQDANGRMSITATIHPLQVVDDWAVTSDGSVALVRGQDYHIDWVRADGTASSTGKVAFQWRHLSDSDKVAFIDSTKAAMERLREQAVARAGPNGGNIPNVVAPPDGAFGGFAGGGPVLIRMGEAAGGDGPRSRNQNGGVPPANFTIPPLQFVSPSELPDYAPPFSAGGVRADYDGNLWVRTTNSMNGGPVYDVIDAKGDLIDRVQLPPGRVIAGFGPGGAVYMGFRDGAGVRLEQARRTSPRM
jgi:hypothetical protein